MIKMHEKILAVSYPDCGPDGGKRYTFWRFIQRMADRLVQGHYRYGKADPQQKYMSRLEREVKEYRLTGNREHLLNAANYCFLESVYPEHTKTGYDPTVESVTRFGSDNV